MQPLPEERDLLRQLELNGWRSDVQQWLHHGISSPNLRDVSFSGNSAEFGGGLAIALTSSPDLTDVTFSGNSAEQGGAV